jgi:ABC-2 type transport system permease protein
MRLAWAFFKRDALTALSYKLDFALQVLARLMLIVIFYFILKSLGQGGITGNVANRDLFSYVLVGIAFADCISVSMNIFAKQIREGQVTGSLEVTLLAPVPLPIFLICSSLWAYFFSGMRLLFYLAVGWLFLGVDFSRANWLAALIVLILTDICFMGVGVLMASGVICFKRGDSATTLFGDLMMFASGALFPIAVLPQWAQKVSAVIPFTPALDCMRAALLKGAMLPQLAPKLVVLTGFTIVCLGAGFGLFSWAVWHVKRHGTLSEF